MSRVYGCLLTWAFIVAFLYLTVGHHLGHLPVELPFGCFHLSGYPISNVLTISVKRNTKIQQFSVLSL